MLYINPSLATSTVNVELQKYKQKNLLRYFVTELASHRFAVWNHTISWCEKTQD